MKYQFLKIEKSDNDKKKYMAILKNKENGRLKKIHFGQKGYSDFTIHKDNKRKENYINRHSKREDWISKQAPLKAGFWSRWILWNKPTFKESLEDTKKKLKKLGY